MGYTPKSPPPGKPEFQDLYDYIQGELQSISQAFGGTDALDLRTTSREPKRPREGMIVEADGTSWDPGAGAGTYKFVNGVWTKFGNASHTHVMSDVTDAGDLAVLDNINSGLISGVTSKRIIGRNTAGSGVAEELTLSQVLDFITSAARGDLLVRGASAWSRLGIGAANKILQSDGTDPNWQDLPATSQWNSLQANNTTSGSNSDFTNIAQTSKALLFIGDRVSGSAGSNLSMQIGTTSSFASLVTGVTSNLQVIGSTTGGGTNTSNSTIFLGQIGTGDTFFLTLIFDYASTTRYKQFISFCQRLNSAAFYLIHGSISTTSAIQHVRFNNSSGSYDGGSIQMIGLF